MTLKMTKVLSSKKRTFFNPHIYTVKFPQSVVLCPILYTSIEGMISCGLKGISVLNSVSVNGASLLFQGSESTHHGPPHSS